MRLLYIKTVVDEISISLFIKKNTKNEIIKKKKNTGLFSYLENRC